MGEDTRLPVDRNSVSRNVKRVKDIPSAYKGQQLAKWLALDGARFDTTHLHSGVVQSGAITDSHFHRHKINSLPFEPGFNQVKV